MLVVGLLIVLRHGHYNPNFSLSDKGKDDIKKITEIIALLSKDYDNIVILSSLANRAMETAEIISKRLNVDIKPSKLLWSDSQHTENVTAALELILPYVNRVDTLVIAVTHSECMSLPIFVAAAKRLKIAAKSPANIPLGGAVALDVENGKMFYI